MAFTITEPTNGLLPSENVSWYSTFDTDNQQANYKYTYDVQVGPVSNDLSTLQTIGTYASSPRIDGGARFSPSSISRTFLEVPFDPKAAEGGIFNYDAYKQQRIIYGSSSATGGVKHQATGGVRRLFQAAIPTEEFPYWTSTKMEIASGQTGAKFLTQRAKTRPALPHETLSILGGTGGASTTLTAMNTISNEVLWYADGFGAAWHQDPNPNEQDPQTPWVEIMGEGVIPTISNIVFFSQILWADPYPNPSYGHLRPGDAYNITLKCYEPYSDPIYDAALWLYGDTNANGWQPIMQMFPININGAMGWAAYGVATEDIKKLGVSYAGESYTGYRPVGSAGTLAEVITWDYTRNDDAFLWKVQGATGPFYFEAKPQALNQLNVGYEGLNINPPYSVSIVTEDKSQTLSETITFTAAECKKDPVSLTWLNALGGYDTYEFNFLPSRSIAIERTIGQKSLESGYTKSSRGILNTSNIGKEIKTVSTNYIRKEEADTLQGLFMSPRVYEVQSDGTVLPVVINSTEYSYYTKGDRLKLIEVSYTMADIIKTQTI